jgi:hypothetical protein
MARRVAPNVGITLMPQTTPKISIQVAAPTRMAGSRLRKKLRDWAAESEFVASTESTFGSEDGGFWNLVLTVTDLSNCWGELRALLNTTLKNEPALHSSLIIVAEGQRGWDDYLLLYHFDPSQRVDIIP